MKSLFPLLASFLWSIGVLAAPFQVDPLPRGSEPRKLFSDGTVAFSKTNPVEFRNQFYLMHPHGEQEQLTSIGIADDGDVRINRNGDIAFTTYYDPTSSDQIYKGENILYFKPKGSSPILLTPSHSWIGFEAGSLQMNDQGRIAILAYGEREGDLRKRLLVYDKEKLLFSLWFEPSEVDLVTLFLLPNGNILLKNYDPYDKEGMPDLLIDRVGNITHVSRLTLPDKVDIVQVLPDSSLIFRDTNDQHLYKTNLTGTPTLQDLSPDLKDLNVVGMNSSGTSLALDGGAVELIDPDGYTVPDLSCLFPNNKRYKISSSLSDIGENRSFVVAFSSFDGRLNSYARLTPTNALRDAPSFCSRVQFRLGESCKSNFDKLYGSFVAKKPVHEDCSVTATIRDTRGKPIKGAEVRLVNHGKVQGDGDGGYYPNPLRFARSGVTNRLGEVTLRYPIGTNRDDFELIAPYRNSQFRSRSIWFYSFR